MRPSKAARTEPIPDSESHHAQMRNQNGVEKADDDDDDDDVCVFGHGLMASSYGNWRLRLGRLNIMGHGSTRTMDVAVNIIDFVVLSWRAHP